MFKIVILFYLLYYYLYHIINKILINEYIQDKRIKYIAFTIFSCIIIHPKQYKGNVIRNAIINISLSFVNIFISFFYIQ